MTAITKNDIKKLYKQGSLRDIDYFLTDTLAREYNEEVQEVLLAAALTSLNMQDKHVCLDIDKVAGSKWPVKDENIKGADEKDFYQVILPDYKAWIDKLKQSSICSGDKSPLVIDGQRLYLRRYFRYEETVAEELLTLAADQISSNVNDSGHSDIGNLIKILFPDADDNSPEIKKLKQESITIQRDAAELILKNRLLIISGGPGTGKTYTLARLIAMLIAVAEKDEKNLSIRMAAPTGKAAMRMRESIRAAKQSITSSLSETNNKSELINILKTHIDDIPENTSTLHRLLGIKTGSPYFRHNSDNPLPADILIIDEASMIDLPMMAKILTALQENTKLILLGDMYQLSSVDPGYVLGDICKAAELDKDSVLGKSTVELTYSHRFGEDSPIGQLSRALHNAGMGGDDIDGEKAWKKLQELNKKDDGELKVSQHDTPATLSNSEGVPIKDFRTLILKNYKEFLNAETPVSSFRALNKFRVFSPLRAGPHGLSTLNKLIEETLSLKNIKMDEKDFRPLNLSSEFYDHRVIMITSNNYSLQLFNGDIGIVMPENVDGRNRNDESGDERQVVWFEATDELTGEKGFRSFPCNMLPPHETAFAMTIHKSQGSQYENIMVIMPAQDNEKLFTKELLYTAITRAEKTVNLWCNENVFKATASRQAECTSGLMTRIKNY